VTQPIRHASPFVDEETRAFWEGCERHELVLQRCRQCHRVQQRPRALCVSCLSDEIEYFQASGRGAVHTFTIIRQNRAPGFAEAIPYVVAWIELEEGVRLLSNVVGCEPDAVRIGMSVEAEYVDLEDGCAVPRFRAR